MTPAQLEAVLQKKYSIKGIVDLGELSTSPQAAFQFFNSVYQSEFEGNDRIVLYTSHEIPEKFLQHLYQVMNSVDISNWFVLMCTPINFVHKTELYSADPVSFQTFKIDLTTTTEFSDKYILPNTICAIPWMHLEIRNNGDITPCCTTSGITIGNINTTTIDQAFHSDKMQNFRQKLLDGKKPYECNRCWKNEERGLKSIRIHNTDRMKQKFLLNYLEKPNITSIDLKFNNTCNFKCRICGPESSSLFAAEQKKFLGIKLSPQNNWSESELFFEQIVKNLPHLTNIDMFGGEPFLIKKFVNVLQIAVAQKHAKNIRLHYNSNGSVWPEEFILHWKHFKEVDIHFSIDAIGKRFALQRGSNWEDVEKNILRIKNLNLPNLTINLMPTISIMNVYYIDEVYNWAEQHGFNIFLNTVENPGYFNINNITPAAQQLIIKKFENHKNQKLRHIADSIGSIVPSDGKKFRDQTNWFDSVRQENFVDSHYEIAKAMGY